MHEQIKNINTLDELQSLYTATFGKNGTMTARLREMKNLDNLMAFSELECSAKTIHTIMFQKTK